MTEVETLGEVLTRPLALQALKLFMLLIQFGTSFPWAGK